MNVFVESVSFIAAFRERYYNNLYKKYWCIIYQGFAQR